MSGWVCTCTRCKTETEITEQFHACTTHRDEVSRRHALIRSYLAEWSAYEITPKAAKPNLMPSAELFQRARDCLAWKSRGYVDDARLFARALLLVELLVKDGHVELNVEREP